MTVGELFETIENPDRVRIVQQGEDVFVGYSCVYESIRRAEVKKFRAVPEIRHKKWEELNLMRPLEPDETPDYCFSDLEMKLYYTIYI